AANAFLDSLAHHRRAQGLPATAINWGPWAGLGMAEAVGKQQQARWSAAGMGTIPPATGLEMLAAILRAANTAGTGQIAALLVDWSMYLGRFAGQQPLPLLADFQDERQTATVAPPAGPSRGRIFTELLQVDGDEPRQAILESYLQRRIAAIIGAQQESIAVDQNFVQLGADSLMVMELLNELQEELQLTLYPREVYERPSIKALATYLAREFTRMHNGQAPEPETMTTLVAAPAGRPGTLAAPAGHPAGLDEGIIFLLSSPRSGSTLLRVMLAGHPDLFSPPELHLLPFITMAERQDQLGLTYLGEGLQRALMELKHIDAAESAALLAAMVAENVPTVQVYALLQQLARPRLLVDKSPSTAASEETLRRAALLFPQARFIHLLRHPYAAIDSFVRQRMHKLLGVEDVEPYQLAEQVWATSNERISHFLLDVDPKRQHLVRFEELVTEPERVMRQLCAFLEIPFDGAVLKPYTGDRMTDGVTPLSAAIEDPNFRKHDRILGERAEAWQNIKLPRPLAPATRQLAAVWRYKLPAEPETAGLAPSQNGGTTRREFIVDVRGLPICVCAWGSAEAPAVFCVHGILDHGAAWEEVALALVARGFQVIAPDLRGHGRSGHIGAGGSYHLLDFLADIDGVVRGTVHDSGPAPFTLLGHSMGAVLALMYAAIRPEKLGALILVEMAASQNEGVDDVQQKLAVHLDYLASSPQHDVLPDVQAAAGRLRQAIPAMRAETALRVAERLTEPYAGGVKWRWDPLLRTRTGIVLEFGETSPAKYAALLGQKKLPLMVVFGTATRDARTRELAQQLAEAANVTPVALPGGHHLHYELPAQLADAIVEATARHKPSKLFDEQKP
ncbi:MAG: alpha/beta fold hydrolase, partial [Chloroflexi bacterium]|nr:alpha/beta fold hydrolase [Chloroflexota bacterium]MCI0578424.1 alpha/beta fold hydrolase [Chloroflexota bacterium]MCI0648164.1 alpha/beta fold hydrolase [Chloroflexota bacterium]MCI0726679.1 alpha/beta fold hydrolase [Chloroflexota bacterium]